MSSEQLAEEREKYQIRKAKSTQRQLETLSRQKINGLKVKCKNID